LAALMVTGMTISSWFSRVPDLPPIVVVFMHVLSIALVAAVVAGVRIHFRWTSEPNSSSSGREEA
jgi:hypothetical protein